MLKPPDLDPKAVRRLFGRRAHRIADADFLLREVEHRMLERLDVVRLDATAVLDVGCGAGHGLQALAQRFPGALPVGVDAALPMLIQARGLARRTQTLSGRLQRFLGTLAGTGTGERLVCADAGRLPFADDRFDLVWSGLAWHWFADPPAVAAEFHRVLKPDGLLMFSSFGVDAFAELRALGLPLQEFPDMHDVGDLLAHSGFGDPVLDTERLSVTWASPQRMLDDLSALGGLASPSRRRGLVTPRMRARWLLALESLRGDDGLMRLSLEIVHAHAWCPPRKKLPDGYAPLVFTRR